MGEQRVFITDKPQSQVLPHGAEKSVEDDDPYALTGVRYPVADGVDADREVAQALVEEFALSGWPPERIGRLFLAPESGSMHEIYQRRGQQLVDEMLIAVFGDRPATEEHTNG